MYKTLIFDIDGTLLNTNELILESFNYISQKYLNKKFNFKELTKFFGPPEDVIIKELFRKNYHTAKCDYYHFYDANFNLFTVRYQQIIKAIELLFENKILLAIYTGKGDLSTYITLEKLGILNYFTRIMTGDNLPEYKPSPLGINSFIEDYKLNKNEVLLVGDTSTDVKAAKAANIDVGLFLWASYEPGKALLENPNYCFWEPNSFLFFVKDLLNCK